MTAAEQYRRFGAAVEAHDGEVILQVGKELVSLEPAEARRFAYQLAGAVLRAEGEISPEAAR